MRAKRVIRRVSDLVGLSDDELTVCLAALREELVSSRWRHEVAIASGALPEAEPFKFDSFTWSRPRRDARPVSGPFGPSTAIRTLPLKRPLVAELEAREVVLLKHLAALTEREVRGFAHTGPATMTRLRELLAGAGLAFAAEPGDGGARLAALEANAALSALGVSARTQSELIRYGWSSAEDLQAASVSGLSKVLSRSALKEVLTLRAALGGPAG